MELEYTVQKKTGRLRQVETYDKSRKQSYKIGERRQKIWALNIVVKTIILYMGRKYIDEKKLTEVLDRKKKTKNKDKTSHTTVCISKTPKAFRMRWKITETS